MAKEESASDVCTNLLRDAKHIVETTKGRQPTMREMGFGNMFAASRGGSSTPTLERAEPAEPRSRGGFIRMLEESSKKTDEDAIQKALDEIVQDETKYATAIERVIEGTIPRQTGFAAMLEAARPSRAIEKPEPEIRGRYGFRAMLDGASRGTTDDTLDEKSHVRRKMGFKAMLDGASRGTE